MQDLLAWKGLSSRVSRDHIRVAAASRANKGRPKSPEQRAKMTESQRKRWQANYDHLRSRMVKTVNPVEVDGVVYESCTTAAQQLGIFLTTLNYWINKGKAKFVHKSET